jgi:ABC-2 type transport system ATP-binding protein
MGTALRVIDLYKVYNNCNVTALDHVSFDVPRQSVCGLLGSNGAGKTTLIKCAVGLLEPTAGSICIGETDITQNAAERLKHVSVVLEGGRNLFWYMTVNENMQYFSLLRGQNIGYNKTYNQDILKHLGIGDISYRRVASLSFGMRQRASIAVALACRSDIIFMDEPTTGLDINYQEELAQLILKLRDVYDCTLIVSSHDMHFVNYVCSDCVLIDKGMLVHSGKISEFKNAFEVDNYIITCHEPLEEKQLFFLKNYINVYEYNDQEQTLEVIWDHSKDFYELTSIVHQSGISISRIEKLGGLASAISSMTKRQVEECETHSGVSV